MNKNINLDKLEQEIVSLGDNIAMISSLVKCIDVIIDDDINFNTSDIANLVVALKKISDDTKEKYAELDEFLGL